jgi:hypothetical protein
MADERIEYIVETRFEGEDDLRQAANAIERVGQAGERAVETANKSASKQKFGWTELKSQVDLAGQALEKVGQIAGQAWTALNEGAAQLRQEEVFGNLAESIGTTADVLEDRLGTATKGLVDDASLIKGASDLISLGLADNEDKAVRLSAVMGALNWDMQVLTLTLANNSMMRLDALGLAMEDIKTRAAGLKQAGMDADAAFDLAVIEAGEAKMRLLGDASQSTAGQLQQLEVVAKNVSTTIKTEFARGVGEGVGQLTGQVDLLGEAIEKAGGRWAYAFGSGAGTAASLVGVVGGIEALKQELIGMGGASADFAAYWTELNDSLDFGDNMTDPQRLEANLALYAALRAEVLELQNAEERRQLSNELNSRRTTWDDFGGTPTRDNRPVTPPRIPPDLTEGYWSYDAALNAVNEELLAQSTLAATVRDAWSEYAAAMTERGGDMFVGFLEQAQAAKEAGETWAYDLDAAMLAAVDSAGAGVGPLSDIAVELGLIDEATAAMLESTTAHEVIAQNIAQAAADGKIAWEDYVTTVEHAIDVYEGRARVVDLGPRTAPEMEDRGYRAGYQEDQQADAPGAGAAVILQADNQAVLDAVSEAKGVVDGFITPEQAYQATMELNIQGVIDGTDEATRLIRGVPARKLITIEWAQSGTDVVAALRAMGLIQ